MTSANPQSTLNTPRLRLEGLCLFLLVATAFLIRLWGMTRMHFWDENVYLLNAQYIAFGKAACNEIGSRPPLLSMLYAPALRVAHSDYAAEIITAFLNALAPAILYLAGRKTIGKTAAAIAALLMALGPYFVGVVPDPAVGFLPNETGHSLLTDCPALTLIILSFWLIVRALEKQTSPRFASAGLCFALAVLMRFGSLASVGVLFLLVFAADRRLKAATACSAGFIVGMAPYLCWSRLHYGGFFETIHRGWSNARGPSEPFLFYALHLPSILSWTAMAGLALCAIRGLAGLLKARTSAALAFKPRSSHETNLLRWEAFLWLWALAILLFFSCMTHKELRYALPVAPPLLLLAGVGLASLFNTPILQIRRAGIAAVVAGLLLAFWPSHHRFDTGFFDPSESDEMEASEFLKQTVPPTTTLYANQNYPDFAWYTGMTTRVLPEGGAALNLALKNLPNEAILIAYRQNDTDGKPVEPILSSLDANPHFNRVKDFDNIALYNARR